MSVVTPILQAAIFLLLARQAVAGMTSAGRLAAEALSARLVEKFKATTVYLLIEGQEKVLNSVEDKGLWQIALDLTPRKPPTVATINDVKIQMTGTFSMIFDVPASGMDWVKKEVLGELRGSSVDAVITVECADKNAKPYISVHFANGQLEVFIKALPPKLRKDVLADKKAALWLQLTNAVRAKFVEGASC